jgi:hypothetical protein
MMMHAKPPRTPASGCLRDGRIGKVDRKARPTPAGQMDADIAPAAPDLEERSLDAMALDETVQAQEHVLLERTKIGHGAGLGSVRSPQGTAA